MFPPPPPGEAGRESGQDRTRLCSIHALTVLLAASALDLRVCVCLIRWLKGRKTKKDLHAWDLDVLAAFVAVPVAVWSPVVYK